MKKLLLTAVASLAMTTAAAPPAFAKSEEVQSRAERLKAMDGKEIERRPEDAKAREARRSELAEKRAKAEKIMAGEKADPKAEAKQDDRRAARDKADKKAEQGKAGGVTLITEKCDLTLGCAFRGEDEERQLILAEPSDSGEWSNLTVAERLSPRGDEVEHHSLWGSGETSILRTEDGIVASVPEPSTWSMMVLGFVGLGAMVRAARKRIVRPVADFVSFN